MPTTVVTGGAGFLGSHLCERLLGLGHRVWCLDNLDTGSLTNIAHLRDDAFTFVQHDVTEYIDIPGDVDYVFHFASPASPIDYLRLPLQTLKVGSYGTHNALGLAKAKRARFLVASTSEVYGDPLIHPQPETYWGNVNPIGPRGVYDEAKRYAEAMTMAYHRQQGVDTAIVRIFNTYGPRMRAFDGRAIPTFVRQALEDGIRAQGSSIRDFRSPDGGYGSMQERFRVYGRDGEPCPACGTMIVKTRCAGRGTPLSPACQPRPRGMRRRPRALERA